MRGFAALSSRRTGTAVLAVALVGISALAYNAHGYPTRHESLNDGSVWVTSDAVGAYGDLNVTIGQLTSEIQAKAVGDHLDVLQNGSTVVDHDTDQSTLVQIDPTQPNATRQAVAVPPQSQVQLGGTTLAVLAPDGTVRAATLDGSGDLSGLVAPTKALLTKVPAGSALAVDSTGRVDVAEPTALVSFDPATTGTATTAAYGTTLQGPLQVTTVGTVPVVASAADGVFLPRGGKHVELPSGSTGLTLQQSGAANSSVAVEDTKQLYEVDLSSGSVTAQAPQGSGAASQPVRLGSCVYAAWAGAQARYGRVCDGTPGAASVPFSLTDPTRPAVFRVNHGQIVLNDSVGGQVWLTDQALRPTDAFTRFKANQKTTKETTQVQNKHDRNDKPHPLPDNLGARPGRPTVLHVLDNDTDPDGDLLVISAVEGADPSQVSVQIASDGQTLVATLPDNASAAVRFRYTVDNGFGGSASTDVTLTPHLAGQEVAPNIRPNYVAPTLSVVAGGAITVQVLADWRDMDGDPLLLASASAHPGSVVTNSDGTLTYTASGVTSGTATVGYVVSDGQLTSDAPPLTVRIVPTTSTQTIPPQTKPDVARGYVGAPITVSPLANDLPGVDPSDPSAVLALAAPVAGQAGLKVSTDLADGTVTVVASSPGTRFLTYAAKFGSAAPASGTIRVDVAPRPDERLPPVAQPDFVTLHGQQPAVVDVLANDYDPNGGVLSVIGAQLGTRSTGLTVAVVAGRYLRIASTASDAPGSRTVTYSLTDGVGSAVTGTVVVTQVPPPAKDSPPVTHDTTVVVRAGTSAAVDVLDSDSDPDGDTLSLAPVPLSVVPAPSGVVAGYAGSEVRVAAPASITTQVQATVDYSAQDPSGERTVGHLVVTVIPLVGHPDQPPAPGDLVSRVIAGDTVNIPVPEYGIDPDGDPVAVTAVPDAPSLGRILRASGDTIVYQAYPLSGGTDQFTYEVADPSGEVGQATVRVGVVPPAAVPPPVAVDDVVQVEPGRTVHIDVLANDFVSAGDKAVVQPLGPLNPHLPGGAHLDGSVVTVQAPASAKSAPDDIAYAVSDGSGIPSVAHLEVFAVPGALLPPIARDDVPDASTTITPTTKQITVHVLANDDDPDGEAADLKIISVFGHPGVTVTGDTLAIAVTAGPQEITYEVRDPDGLTAEAVVRVPGNADPDPHLIPDAEIHLDAGATQTFALGTYVVDPQKEPLSLVRSSLPTSPSGSITAVAKGATSFSLTAEKAYAGPAAVSLQVTDGTSPQAVGAHTVTLTIPVQVGPEVPILRCPTTPIQVVQGGSQLSPDISSLCHVWVDPLGGPVSVRYTASWQTAPAGVTVASDGAALQLQASGSAKPGAQGVATIGVAGSSVTATVPVTVVAAPLPVASAVSIPAVTAGKPVTVDLAPDIQSPLARPDIAVLGVQTITPDGGTGTARGTSVTITPSTALHGQLQFAARVTDEANQPQRAVSVPITLNVLNRPDAPGTPVIDSVASHTIKLAFTTPADNGSPITSYQITDSTGGTHTCAGLPCTIAGLKNGTAYTFTVKAVNAIGESDPSGSSAPATPDELPADVTNLVSTDGDQKLTVTWVGAVSGGTPVKGYRVTISPGPDPTQTPGAGATSATFTGLTNGAPYTVTVAARNSAPTNGGFGPVRSASGIPYGKPTVQAPTATSEAPASGTTPLVDVKWPAGDGNGRGITSYQVSTYRDGALFGVQPASTTALAQTEKITADGHSYSFELRATNSGIPPLTSDPSASNAVEGANLPDNPSDVSVSAPSSNAQLEVSFTEPSSNAKSISEVDYSFDGSSTAGSWTSGFHGPGQTDTFQTNSSLIVGHSYTVWVKACNDASASTGSPVCSSFVASHDTAVPYQPPGAPSSVGASQNGNVVTYTPSGSNDGGYGINHYQVCDNIHGCASVSPGGSVSYDYGYSANWSAYAVAYDAHSPVDSSGNSPTSNGSTPSPPPPPSPSIAAYKGSIHSSATGTCAANSCDNMKFTVSNFTPGTYTWTCLTSGSPSYQSSPYTVKITSANQSFDPGTGSGYCAAIPSYSEQIVINGVTSDVWQ